MSVTHITRSAGIDEIAAEMDRRGEVIDSLESRIAELEASLAEAMEALEPFADQAVEYIDDVWNDNDIVDNMQVRVRHLRRARDVYSKREAK